MGHARRHVADAPALRERAGARRQPGGIARVDLAGIAPARAVLALQSRPRPTLRPGLQRIDRIGYAEIDQQLRPDDRARAARAVDHDRGRRVGDDVPDAERELAVRTADPARDAHLVVFGERTAVDDHETLPRVPHGLEGLRGHARGVTLMLDQLAESLA